MRFSSDADARGKDGDPAPEGAEPPSLFNPPRPGRKDRVQQVTSLRALVAARTPVAERLQERN
jgi:hypothetical protein